MKKIITTISAIMIISSPLWAAEGTQKSHDMMHHDMMSGMQMHHADMEQTQDSRTSLKLPAPMRTNQLAMMREHLKAVDDIIAYIATGDFDAASHTAHSKLGLTPEMKKMCNMFGNDDFRTLGLAFHKSADELGDVLKTGDLKRSLTALHRTMDNCVRCHATFRQ